MLEDFRLKVFMAVSEEGSFTRAARKLGITQPAVSQNVAELEKDLGTVLFTRNRGAVSLTPSGKTFKEYASRILYWYSAAGVMFGPQGRLASGRPVRVSADCLAEALLPSVLSRLVSACPGLSFDVSGSGDVACDLRIWGSPHAVEQTIEEGASLLCVVQASAVSSSPALSALSDIRNLPSGVGLAVWSPYVPLLPAGLGSRVCIESGSVSVVEKFALVYRDTIALLPRGTVTGEGLAPLPVSLPSLAFDLRMEPSDGFSGTPVFSSLRTLFENFEL